MWKKNPVPTVTGWDWDLCICPGSILSRIELKTEAEYYMRELANRLSQVVFLAIRKDNEVVYIDKIEKYDSTHRFAIIGQTTSILLHCHRQVPAF